MKKRFLALIMATLMLAMLALTGCGASTGTTSAAETSAPTGEFEVPENLAMDWSGSTDTEQVKHHTYAEYQTLMEELVKTYPDYCTLYSIGHTSQERNLWCLEITNSKKASDGKTGIGVFGNIHGGEMESA